MMEDQDKTYKMKELNKTAGKSPDSETATHLSIEVFNVIMCLKLMSLCCEGKSDLAEIKCQNEIMNLNTCLTLFKKSGKFWPFKCAIVMYVSHLYLDSGDTKLFSS